MLSRALPSDAAITVAGTEFLRVEVLTNGTGRRAVPGFETSTRRSFLPPPPLPPAQTQIIEGPVQPALRRFRGTKHIGGGRMSPPK